jgi:adenosylhomocysteinase
MSLYAPPSIVKDEALAPAGRNTIEFAGSRMPVLRAITERFAEDRPLAGARVAACLHVTTETANLCRALTAGGAELAVCASNPLSTKDEVAAAMAAEPGTRVYAIRGCDRDTFYQQVSSALAIQPTVVIDDGADLTATIHRHHRELLDEIVGGTEVTTSGVLRIRNMHADGVLSYPVLDLNDALTKHLFDNRYGTGQSTMDGILRASNILLAGKVLVVHGYGWCGRGVGARARGMGARVVVCEVDPIKALEAILDGFEVLSADDAAPIGDVFVTVTGNRDVITVEQMRRMKSGAVLANSGHFDLEIDVSGLRTAAHSHRELRPNLVEYDLGDRRIVVLAEGRLVGQSAAEASPAEVMDMTFSTEALAIEHLVAETRARGRHPAGVHEVPHDVVERVARLKLDAFGVHLSQLSSAQAEYQTAWQGGT